VKPRPDIHVVWVPVSEVAEEYGRTSRTITRWCHEGFPFQLGYQVKRDETGHWLIGVPTHEYQTFKTAQARQPSLV